MPVEPLVVTTSIEIAAQPDEIFEAIVDPEKMSGYFISSGSARLDQSHDVEWRWDDCGARAIISPIEIKPNTVVCFSWAASGTATRVRLDLERKESSHSTLNVSESEWKRDDEGIAMALQQTQGWMHMLCCLKAYLEFGINLRAGKPNG